MNADMLTAMPLSVGIITSLHGQWWEGTLLCWLCKAKRTSKAFHVHYIGVWGGGALGKYELPVIVQSGYSFFNFEVKEV
jgi:hypothetical protein